MNSKQQRRSSRLRLAAWSATGLLLLGSSGWAQLSRSARARSPVYPLYYDAADGMTRQTNRVKGRLKGAEGRFLSNDLAFITEMQLEHYTPEGVTNLIAWAPECYFASETKVAWSTGKVDILGLGGAFYIHGAAGFEARMTNNTMNLSNRVRTVIRQDLLKSSSP